MYYGGGINYLNILTIMHSYSNYQGPYIPKDSLFLSARQSALPRCSNQWGLGLRILIFSLGLAITTAAVMRIGCGALADATCVHCFVSSLRFRLPHACYMRMCVSRVAYPCRTTMYAFCLYQIPPLNLTCCHKSAEASRDCNVNVKHPLHDHFCMVICSSSAW